MQLTRTQRAAFREQAARLDKIDTAAYRQFDKDRFEPVIGSGEPRARIGFFGRDPGREEIRHGIGFIGTGGQKVRVTLHRHLYREAMPDFAASMALNRLFFWANTVPYKPVGNKAWPMRVKRAFQPLVAEILTSWQGRHVITLGREAFLWFGINQPRAQRTALEDFWAHENRFSAVMPVELAHAGTSHCLHLHPLPHPSPLNATWYQRFPGLLSERLRQLDARPDNLLTIENR